MILKKRTQLNNEVVALGESLGISADFAALLYSRGVKSPLEAEAFFNPSADMLLPPSAVFGMEQAVFRIKEAIKKEEKILVFGDYDCDGICATAILKLYLESEGITAEHYIPSRAEGYGLSIEVLEELAEEHLPDLIITVDCGITAVEEVAHCHETLGIDIIVTDHHEPTESLPDCIIVNPKLNTASPLKDICGAGVAFKLVEGLAGRKKALEYIDLACLATIADVVPLTGENRQITFLGLQTLNRFERLGIKLLAHTLKIDRFTAGDVAFRVAPMINAPSRMGASSDIVALLTSGEYFEVESIVRALSSENEKRQALTNQVHSQALEQLKRLRHEQMSVIILMDSKWNAGVLGLVASKLAREFQKPVILLNSKEEFCRGSARSLEGINIFKCLSAASEFLEEFGGHSGAAGLTVNIARLNALTEFLDSYIWQNYKEELGKQVLEYDIQISDSKAIDISFYRMIERFEPTGAGNPRIQLLIDSNIAKIERIGNTNHVKIKLGREAEAVGFNALFLLNSECGAEYSLIGHCGLNTYGKREYVTVSITDHILNSIDKLIDNPNAYGEYLKTALSGAGKFNARIIGKDKLIEELGEDNTLFVAYTAESARDLLKTAGNISISISKSILGNISLLVFPEVEDYSLFRKVVLLDAPLSAGHIAAMEKQSEETEFVCVASYGYRNIISEVDLSDNAIKYTYGFLTNYAKISGACSDYELMYQSMQRYGYRYSAYDFVTHVNILTDCGAVSICGKEIAFARVALDCSASRIVKTLRGVMGKK